jgi:hypothetical protein
MRAQASGYSSTKMGLREDLDETGRVPCEQLGHTAMPGGIQTPGTQNMQPQGAQMGCYYLRVSGSKTA